MPWSCNGGCWLPKVFIPRDVMVGVKFLKSGMSPKHVAYPSTRRNVISYFIEIGENEVNEKHGWNAKIAKGSQSMHSIQSVSHIDKIILSTRKFSYFSDPCIYNLVG